MTALTVEIAHMIYAVPDISPFTSTTKDELLTLYPLLRSLKLITSEKMLRNSHEVCNDFGTKKTAGIELEIMPIKEKVAVSRQEMVNEIARLLFYLTCESSKVRGKMVI